MFVVHETLLVSAPANPVVRWQVGMLLNGVRKIGRWINTVCARAHASNLTSLRHWPSPVQARRLTCWTRASRIASPAKRISTAVIGGHLQGRDEMLCAPAHAGVGAVHLQSAMGRPDEAKLCAALADFLGAS